MTGRISLVGETIDGRFKVLRVIGDDRGTTLYAAVQSATGRPVMLRVLPPDPSQGPEYLTWCQRNLRAASRLRHPNTAAIYGYGQTEEGLFYIANEALPGESLREVLDREGQLPFERASRIISEVCGSLTEAHAIGVVHGALTPAAVVIEQRGDDTPRVRVRDYGLAGLLPAEAPNTEAQQAGPDVRDYVSPESSVGKQSDARGDLYSLGVILFEMLVGRNDPGAGGRVSTLWEVQSELRIPAAIDGLLASALSRRKEDRLPSAGVFRERLEESVARFRQDPRAVRVKKLSEYRRVSEAAEAAMNISSTLSTGNGALGADSGSSPLPPVRLRKHAQRRFLILAAAGLLAIAISVTAVLLLHPWEPSFKPSSVRPGVALAGTRPTGDAVSRADGSGGKGAGDLGKPAVPCVTVRIESVPPDAEVFEGGHVLGRTPLDVCRAPGSPALNVLVRATGHMEQPVRVPLEAGRVVQVMLSEMPSVAVQGPRPDVVAGPPDAGVGVARAPDAGGPAAAVAPDAGKVAVPPTMGGTKPPHPPRPPKGGGTGKPEKQPKKPEKPITLPVPDF